MTFNDANGKVDSRMIVKTNESGSDEQIRQLRELEYQINFALNKSFVFLWDKRFKQKIRE